MSNYDELIGILKELLFNRYLPQPQIIKGLLGDGTGVVRVPGRKDFNYARFNRGSSKSFEVFNKTVPEVDGWPILMSEFPWQPGLIQVVGTDWEAYIQSGWGDSVSTANPHAPTHVWRDGYIGSDPLNVYMRMIAPGRAYSPNSTGTVVYVNSFEYHTGTIWPGTPGIDLAPLMSSIPTGTARFAGVYVNPDNTLGVVTGATSVDTQAFDPPLVTFPFGVIPKARVRLYGGQAGLKEIDFRDARRIEYLPPTGTAGGGSPTGLAGGDLTGSYPDPRVAGLFGYSLVNTAPGEGNVLMFSGSAWRPTYLETSVVNSVCDGRLTLFSGVPYLTFSVTAATAIRFTPTGRGGQLSLYDGADWQTIFLTEKSVAVPSVSLRLFDIFGYLISATDYDLETVNWASNIQSVTDATNATPIVITTSASHGLSANDLVSIASVGGNTAANGIWSVANVTGTTFELEGSAGSGAYTSGGTMRQLNIGRATGLVKQDGVWVKDGDATRRYLGTGMTTITSGQTAFSPATNGGDLLLWNYYNRAPVVGIVFDFTSHTYTGGARVYRGQNGNKIPFVIGVIEDAVTPGISSEFNFDSGDSEVVTGLAINRTGALTYSNRISDVGQFRYTTDFGPFYPLNTGFNFMQAVQTGGATSPDFLRVIIRSSIMM